jgi:hypothetical protein
MSVILRPDFPAKPHRIPVSGATPSDVEQVKNVVDVLISGCAAMVMGQLKNLSENLPMDVAQRADFESIYAQFRDLRSEALGRLEQIEESLS